jgi:hypothetical protein
MGNLRFEKNWNGWRKLKRCRCISVLIANGNQIAGGVAELKPIQKFSHRFLSRNELRHDCKREIERVEKENMVGNLGIFDTVLFPADNSRFPLLRPAIILERVIRNRLVPVYP